MKRVLILLSFIYLIIFSFSCGQQSNSSETQVGADSTFSELYSDSTLVAEDLVCTLKDDELLERKEILQKEIFSKVKKVEEVSNGYIFHFDDENGMLLKLTDHILVEQKCCSFFRYDLSIQPKNKGIAFKVSGGLGVKMFIKMQIDDFGII